VANGQRVGRGLLLLELARRMDTWLDCSQEDLRQAWQAYLWGRGQRVHLRDQGASYDVVVLGTAADGSLIVRLPNGRVQATSTGELIL
jgi:biotin-(acetyl-CoA carboxylase) ligase